MSANFINNQLYEATCVIIPTYNNHKTLHRVIEGVLHYTQNIIVVNDGSTDETTTLLKNYPQLTQIHFSENKGKGMALRVGFKKAKELNFRYAITIDSDGQHYPDDIPQFIKALENENQEVLLIGSRNMNQEGVPKKSSFGNKFSNFWFWFETGIKLEDTQSGYRLYPLHVIPKKFFTRKFEFEIEVIVRTAWNDVPVKNIPIKILYDPNERVSHFRPFRDFSRISVLNTVLVIISLLYIKPRDLIRKLLKKKFKDFVREDILGGSDSTAKKATSIALGVFIGISPLWGFQTILVIALAVLFRLNKVLAFAFSNISFPLLIPFIIFVSLKMGALFVGSTKPLQFDHTITLDIVKSNVSQYLVGSFILATLSAIVFGLGSYLLLSLSKKPIK